MHVPSRRLAVIMVGDIVGFTAHMAIDERQALAFVGQMRRVVKPLVTAYDGQWVKDVGDGFLASFDSAVEAIACAVAIQQALRGDPAFQLRLGIHLGDVVFEDDDVLGDGVNIAARLEMLAVPGGICASGQIVDLVRNQPGLRFARLGVTNLPHQLEAYAVAASDQPLPTVAEALAGREADAVGKIELVDAAASLERDRLERAVRRWRRAAAALAVAAALAAAGLLRLNVQLPGAAADPTRVLVADAGHDYAAPDAAADAARRAATDTVAAQPLQRAVLAAAGEDDVRLSARFNELLRRTLASRGAARIVPDAEVRALAARLRLPAGAALTPPLALQVAARDRSIRAVVVGDVRRVGSRHMLSVDALPPAGGAAGGAWTDAAASNAELLPAMQRLADTVAAALPSALDALPTPAPAATDAALDVTTSDAAALAAHGEALAAARDGRWRDALDRAGQAVALDPAFGLARVVAAEAARRLGRAPAAALVGGGSPLTATLGAAEAALVDGAALRLAGDCDGAARSIAAAAAEAPALAAAYADLDLLSAPMAQACAGDLDGATAAMDRAVASRPADAVPAAARLRLELARGDDVAAARRAALVLARRAPDGREAEARLLPAIELAASGDLAGARAKLPTAAGAADGDLAIRIELVAASLAAAGGDVAAAAEHTRRAADQAERQAATGWQAAALWQLAWLDRLRGDDAAWTARLADLSAALPPPFAAAADAWRLADRARAGDATARDTFDRTVGPRLPDRRDRAAFRAYIDGQRALAGGDAPAAARAFAAAAAAAPNPILEPPTIGLRPDVARLALAEAEAVTSPPQALATLDTVRGRALGAFADPLAVGGVTWLRAQARAGRLHEAGGQPEAAVAAYETALRWWGDSPLAEAAALRARVAALTDVVR